MSYLDTPHKRKSLVITIILHLILLLLLIFVGLGIKEEENDGGIAVNFGNVDTGSGNVQPTEPVETAPTAETTPEEIQEETEQTEATEEAIEEVATQDNIEAPAVQNKKEKKPAVETKKEKPKPVERKPDASTKNALDSFLNGPKSSGAKTGGEGNDKSGGDKGNPNGDPNAKSYYGTGKGLDGDGNYRLGGRKALNKEKNIPDCNETGTVVVKITVNQQGKVVSAVPGIKGTTNTAPCLLDPAKRAALATRFNSDANAPSRQVGSIVYTFKLSE